MYYRMFAEECIEDYVRPAEDILALEKGCIASEYQFINRDALRIEADERGGVIFPDLISCGVDGCIVLASRRFWDVLVDLEIDNLFKKDAITISVTPLGRQAYYRLLLPPRINCLDTEESELIEKVFSSFIPELSVWRAKKITIASSAVGRYHIFRIAGISNQDIIVTERVKEALEAHSFENVHFAEL